jgi:hypothetical protein
MNNTPQPETTDHSSLWNDLPLDERKRLMPYQIECQIRHLEQARRMAVNAHRRLLADIDGVIENCRRHLKEEVADASGST